MTKYKLKIKLKSFDHRLLERSTRELVSIAMKNGAVICGPIPLPIKTSAYIVNRSPHKDKKSREQFGVKVYKRLLLLLRFDNQLIRTFTDAQLPAGVEVKVLVV